MRDRLTASYNLEIRPIVLASALAWILLAVPSGAALAQMPPGGPPPTVITDVVRMQAASPIAEFIGRVQPIRDFEARARVEGVIEEVGFQEGANVEAGALLYVIEPAPYQAVLDSANADVERAQAQAREAERSLARVRELRSNGNASQAQLDQVQATRDGAAADVLVAKAKQRQAELNLGYTRVTAPAKGRIGATAVTEGDLVNPAAGVLATVVQIDPIRVVFSVTDRDVQTVQQQFGVQSPTEAVDRFLPTLRMSNGQEYPEKGKVQFLSNRVDQRTGTVPVYADFANPQGLLLPGQFVTVHVQPMTEEKRAVVPISAVLQDRDGSYVLVLDDQNRVQQRRIETAGQVEQNYIVSKGLTEGETIIIDGSQKVRPGITVQPTRAPPPSPPSSGSAPATSQ